MRAWNDFDYMTKSFQHETQQGLVTCEGAINARHYNLNTPQDALKKLLDKKLDSEVAIS